ncbi:polycomb group protein EMBRYONIC FLOWER 2-like [Glycine soja]|uniref:Polycomb group protein EMF2B isoform B n=2 Tax=Glycine soja TaxID=3848 RepID=A0A445M5X3_GLYSO|nr:polycomb group protein EMBRYONIC FLOWER 2-like [Glycine soja]KHN42668.1 Polycomb group protein VERNALIZATION 2 [Glycine soja]RZC30986.1 Polycomb group protein EMF2B isoform B [Glycine soja]RZC30987.1 Polycomb group protein EMF2B isoform C [Glycine soja]
MCRQNSPVHHAGEEEIAADESLLIYCKPVELYNILYRRALQNPSFLRRCLRYKIRASRKRRLRAGIVIFNYRDRYNILRKTEVTEDFSCPFCLMQCGNFKGLRFHLCSSHDLFNFEFWVTEDYQAVNVSVKIDILRSENVADGVIPQSQTFFFCSRPRKRRRKDSVQIEKRTNVKFLELDSPEGIHNGFLQKDDDILSCKGENVSRTSRSEKILPSGRNDGGKFGPDHPGTMDNLEHVESSFNIPGVSIAMPQSSVDPECSKSICKSDPALPAKTKKLSMDRSDSRNRMLLQKRLFFHSHRVQPMALEQVLSDRDSEDEVDDDIADLEDRRMLDDFVDVSKDEKQLMHLWNSFMRKQRVLADGHVPWACEAFSKLHGKELISSPALFWCWRLFMIKLWNHGLLDACTMNNCSIVLDSYRNEGSDTRKN